MGSAGWITDANGYAIQYMHYLPYGQLLANQMTGLYDERYKFTGKERDAETGYDYFGARFYSSQLLHWTSVDQLADTYPWISPYAYCNQDSTIICQEYLQRFPWESPDKWCNFETVSLDIVSILSRCWQKDRDWPSSAENENSQVFSQL